MGLVLLVVFYLLLSTAVAVLASWLEGVLPPWRRWRDPALRAGLLASLRGWLLAVLVLTLLPLAFTVQGFLPGVTLSPTPVQAGVAPWAHPEMVQASREENLPNPLLLDPLSQFIPWREAARRDLLFNPSQGGGAALLANGQSAVLYPTEVMARWLPAFRATTFSQAARLLLAGWGAFLLAGMVVGGRHRRGEEGAARPFPLLPALATSVVWVGCGFVQLWRLHPHTLVAATAPWVVYALLWLVRRPGARPAVGLALAGTVSVAAGHPETLLHVLILALAVAAVVWLWDRRVAKAGRPAPILAWGGVAAALAALLSAPLLLPFVEALRVSSEWAYRSDVGTIVEIPLPQALERLRPAFALYALGNPLDGTWSGPENLVELAGGSVGAAALLLALFSFAGRRRGLAAGLLLVGLVGLAVSIHLPVLSRPFGEIPLLRESLLKRLSLWWALAAALLAGLGLQAWQERREDAGPEAGAARGVLRHPAVAAVLAAAVVAAVVAWAGGGPGRGDGRTAWEWGTLGVATLVLLAGTFVPRGRGGREGWIAALLTVLLFASLLAPRSARFGSWIPPVGPAGYYAETGATEYVEEAMAAAGPLGYRVVGVDAALVPHSAAFFGFPEVRAYDPMTFAPYADFLSLAAEPPPGHRAIAWQQILDPASPPLVFLGVRWVFDHPSAPVRSGLEPGYLDRGARVHENPAALPRAFTPQEVELHPTPQEALAAAGRIEDFSRLVTLSAAQVGPLPEGASPAVGRAGRRLPSGPAELVDLVVEPRRITAEVVAEARALVATSQPAIPGWRLTVDGEPETAMWVNGAFLGAVVEEGRHRVELVYAPRSWSWGLGLFAGGLVLSLGLLLLPRVVARRRGGGPGVVARGRPA